MPGSFNIHKDTSATQYFGMTARKSLRKHAYSSIKKISPPKTENFQIKTLTFFIFLLKTLNFRFQLCFRFSLRGTYTLSVGGGGSRGGGRRGNSEKTVYDAFFGIQGGRRLRTRVVSTR